MADAIGIGSTMIAISPPAVRHTPDHPPYAEMIQSAIRSLAEEEGSTFSAIDDYIKANYHDLPWGHPNLYPHYLRKLLSARELFLSPSGRFLLSDPHLPPPDLPPPPPTSKRRLARHPRIDRQIPCSITGKFIKQGAVAPTRMLKRRRKRGRPKFFRGAVSNRRVRAAVETTCISLARDVEPLQIAGEGGSQLQPHSGSTPSNTTLKRKRGRPRLYEATSSSRNVRAAAKTGVPLARDVAPLLIAADGGLSASDAGLKRGATVRRRKRGRSRFSMATFRSRKVRTAVTTGVSPVEEVEPLQIAVEEGGPLEPDADLNQRATMPKRKRGRAKLFTSSIRSRKLQDATKTGDSPMKDVEPLQIVVEEGGPSEPDVSLKLRAMMSKRGRGQPRLFATTVGSRMVQAAAMIGVSPVKDIEPLQIAVEAGGSLTPTQLGKYVCSDGADHVPSPLTDIVVTEVPLGFTTPLSEVQQSISNAHDEAVASSNLVDAVDGIMTDTPLTLPSPTCLSNPPSRTPVPRKRGRPAKKRGPKASLKKSGSIQVSHSHFVDSSLVPAEASQLQNTNAVHWNDGIVKLPMNLSAHMPELTDTTNDRAVMLPMNLSAHMPELTDTTNDRAVILSLEAEASESLVGNVVFSEKHDAYSIDDHGGGTIPLEMDISRFSVDNAVGSGNNEAHTVTDFGTTLPLEREASEFLVDNVVGSEKHKAIDEGITQRPGVADTDSEHGGLLPLDRKTPESDKRANSEKRKARWTPPEHRPEPPKLRPRVTKQ